MRIHVLAIVGVAGLVQASGLFARNDVLSRYSHWERRLRERVNAQLTYPLERASVSGDVLVGFRIGKDGKPADVRVERSSGYPIFDESAVRLVSHLGRLGPVPSANGTIDKVTVKISYGDPSSSLSGAVGVTKADWQERAANERRDRSLVTGEVRLVQSR